MNVVSKATGVCADCPDHSTVLYDIGRWIFVHFDNISFGNFIFWGSLFRYIEQLIKY